MVIGIVNQAVIGIDDALRTAGILSFGINVAFVVLASLLCGKLLFIVAEVGSADGGAFFIPFHGAAGPAERFGFRLRNVVAGQLAVRVDVKGNVILRIIRTVFVDCRSLGRLRCGRGLRSCRRLYGRRGGRLSGQ